MASKALDKEREDEKREAEELALPDYQTVEKRFGKEFADLYKAAPTGGKTELLKYGLDALQRGENVKDMFAGMDDDENISKQGDMEDLAMPQLVNGKLPIDFKFPDYTKRPKGLTAKDWAMERKEWGKENSKLYEESRSRLKGLDRDILGAKKLSKLNDTGKIGEGFGRTLINPSTGEFYGLAQLTGSVPKEAQEWVKEIARFGNRAKEAFGSRVTNFDLIQYMKQFPGLLNTNEGRKGILRMMQINYDLDRLYESARQQIYHKKGRTSIPPEEVDRLAREMVKDDTERLENEFLGLERKNEDISMEKEGNNRPSLEEIFG